ncbi:MFS transporter [Lentzea pudingi]|uniref:MFS transporter n=2 Tax=Lentzea pudingi TaxID=1789439 RepID=A0ABQ2INS5_9PSEU|nr:MFS transporter [Lentzea pudingi]
MHTAQRRDRGLLLTAAIVLAALALRPAIVAIGPLATEIQQDTGLGVTMLGLLTTVPLLCLGLVASGAAFLSEHLGIDRAVLIAVGLIAVGIVMRLLAPLPLLFAGTVVAASGIAVGNVLIPAAIKHYRPHRLGATMTVYSVALQSGAAVAAAVTVPLGRTVGLGWRGSLAMWGLPAAVAFLAWLPRAVRGPSADSDSAAKAEAVPVWRTRLGWSAGLFIGLQSGIYFALAAWLPTLLTDNGMTADAAGYALSLVGLAGIASGLPIPVLAVRMRRQHSLVFAVTAAFGIGLLGLVIAPTGGALLWATVLGLGQGGGLSLALTLFTLRARDADSAARLSGMAQTVGYLVAALGPLAAGWTNALTGGWTVPIVVLLAVLAPFTAAGVAVAQPRYINDETTERKKTS